MRTVHEQLAAVLDAARPVAPLDVVLADAAGAILAEDVTAEVPVPEVDVAAHDGYAVRAVDVGGSVDAVPLPVVQDALVHERSPQRLVGTTAIRVASGAPVPVGADAVVPRSRTDRGEARVAVRGGARPGEGVRPAGSDIPAGAVVLRAGLRLTARHLAAAAAVRRSRLRVHPAPRVVVVTVGDELAEPGRGRRPGAVPDSVGHALAAAVQETGAVAVRVGPVGDDHATLREVLQDQLVRADLLLVVGGIGDGPWDTVTDVLAPLGTVRFDQVAMTPGQRHGSGTVDGVPVLALPGHPVAALVGFEVFVRPALRAMAGYGELFRPSVRAAVARPFASPPGVRQFVPVALVGGPVDGYTATPVGDPATATLQGLAGANGLAVVGEETTVVRAGDTLACLVLEG